MFDAEIEEGQQDKTVRIGQMLREGRKRRFPRDTQVNFARRIGVSPATYKKMERGGHNVRWGSYLRAAYHLGILENVVEGFATRRHIR